MLGVRGAGLVTCSSRNGTAIIISIILSCMYQLCALVFFQTVGRIVLCCVIHYVLHPFIQAEAMNCHNEA